MTREELVQKIEDTREKVNGLVCDYNAARAEKNVDEMARLDEEIEKAVNDHTSSVRSLCFLDCKESGDPMLFAVKVLSYQTVIVKDEKDKETGVVTRTINNKDKKIDLRKLDEYCGGIGKDSTWPHIAAKINFLLTVKTAIDLGIDPKTVNDSYAIKDIAKNISLGKTPTSKNNMIKTLQMAVTAMVGEEYKATSHDVNFLMNVYSKKGKTALSVACSNNSHFIEYLAEICHKIVLDEKYNVDYKKKKA